MDKPEFVDPVRLASDQSETRISFSQTYPVSIQVRNLSIGSRKNNAGTILTRLLRKKSAPGDIESNESIKPILHPMSFDIPSNSLTCIMGGSGSGKTTLLNFLAHRHFSKSSLETEGEIRYNNEPNPDGLRHAYVIQQDILIPTLTCFETLAYAAELRLPKLTSKEERTRLVNEIILELGLKECANTIVGDNRRKGMSGGERRRLSVAIQLVSNPSLLFLDEPTTGLDSYNAYLLCATLKRLVKKMNKTIIMSIHQPSADIFKLFDRVLLLSQGHLCYGDSSDKVMPHFAEIGYPVPELKVNPADFLIDNTTVDTRTVGNERESAERMNLIARVWEQKMKEMPDIKHVSYDIDDIPLTTTKTDLIFQDVGRAPFWREVGIHVRRNLRLETRDPLGVCSVIFEAIFLGVISGWIFRKPGTDAAGIRSYEAALYTGSTLVCYLYTLVEAYRLCQVDLKIFDRERMENCVSVPGFLLGRRISKLVTEDLIIPFFYSLTAYFLIGFRTDSAVYFWKYFAGIFIFNLNTMAAAMLASAINRDVAVSTLICNLNFTFQSMTNGMFVNATQLPVWIRWSKYAAYMWYSFGYLLSNQFTGFQGDCFRQHANDPDVASICATSSGTYILRQMGFWPHWNALPICVVLAFFLVTYVIAGIVLYLKPVDISMGKDVKKSTETSSELAEVERKPEDVSEEVSVSIRNIDLAVKTKMGKIDKQILCNVNADFQPAQLNVIMGPSGSGKTSLLNLLSGRLSSNLATSYSKSGQMFFNDQEIDDFSAVKALCSYVSQEDDHLLSTLTVHETLTYAATLRLYHSNLSKAQRAHIVDQTILQMGLKDCANTLVGNELIKGISGGEKRRLSIAVQLLSSPKVLFLDEPTSGLDAFTASFIIERLNLLAQGGTTVIMTIHQPRTLDNFASVLLLAKGGRVAFDGSPEELVGHFSKIGYPVPKFTNLGDFVIDIISYNTASEAYEKKTRSRVERILSEWHPEYSPLENVQLLQTKDQVRRKFRSFVKEPAGFVVGVSVLARRQWKGLKRDVNLAISRAAQTVGMGFILIIFFARLKHDALSVQNRLGLIQQLTSLYFGGMLSNVACYPPERNNFYNEYNDDVVTVGSFFVSYLLVEVPFEIFSCLVFTVLLVFVIGFQYEAGLFFGIFFASFMLVNAGESLGISFNTVMNHPGFSLTVVSVFCSVAVCMSGLMSMKLDAFLSAVNYFSPAHYCVMIAANLTFTNRLHLHCTPSQMAPNGSCPYATGDDVISQYNIGINLKLYCGLLALVAVAHRAIAFLLLKIKLMRITIKKKSE